MRILVDTCVLIDSFHNREPFAEYAQTLLFAMERKYVVGCITASSLTDLYYVSHQRTHSNSEARRVIDWVLRSMEVLDTTGEDCRRALASGRRDFEDAVEIETAVRERLDAIVTRNVRDFEDSPIPVYTPQGFVEKFLRGGEMGEALR